jgi:hypothetical protein
MDSEVMAAIESHQAKFRQFNASIYGLNFSDPNVRARVLDAINKAIARGVPITDSDIGVDVPDGAVI